MIQLQSGNYLGSVSRLLNADGVIASITTYPDTNYSESLHYHETLHMSFVIAGGNLEKRINTDIERLPGISTFYDAGERHRSTRTLAHSKHLNIEIEDSFLELHEINIDAAKIRSARNPNTAFLMFKVLNELQANDELSKCAIQALLLSFLNVTVKQVSSPQPPSWFQVACEVLQDRWNETVSLSKLAAATNVHPVTLSKHFPKYAGCTLGEYMRKIKTERALASILASSDSLTGIAAGCGFADQSHFIRAFKQQLGFAPGRCKKLLNC